MMVPRSSYSVVKSHSGRATLFVPSTIQFFPQSTEASQIPSKTPVLFNAQSCIVFPPNLGEGGAAQDSSGMYVPQSIILPSFVLGETLDHVDDAV